MRFSTIFAAASVFSLGLLVSASPVVGVAVEKRQEASVQSALTTLQSTIAPDLSAITSLGSSASYDDVAPHITAITNAFKSATDSINAIPKSSRRDLAVRQSGDQLADLLAQIIEDVVKVVDGLVGQLAKDPLLATLLGGLDGAIASLLRSVESLLANVLEVVAQLLKNVSKLLSDLAFDLTLASLGL